MWRLSSGHFPWTSSAPRTTAAGDDGDGEEPRNDESLVTVPDVRQDEEQPPADGDADDEPPQLIWSRLRTFEAKEARNLNRRMHAAARERRKLKSRSQGANALVPDGDVLFTGNQLTDVPASDT